MFASAIRTVLKFLLDAKLRHERAINIFMVNICNLFQIKKFINNFWKFDIQSLKLYVRV